MDIDVIPTLIEQFRETFEGEVPSGRCWITDGRKDAAVLGSIEPLSPEEAFTSPVPGGKSIAAHVAHLRFSLDLTAQRLRGENPPADWASSFEVAAASAEAWQTLQRDLRRSYDAVIAILNETQSTPLLEWPPVNVVGLAAITAHNAYHLGAIRQLARIVQSSSPY